MSLETIIVSAVVGIVTSAITAYVTTRLRMKEEKEKWRREFAVKFAEAQATDNAHAQKIAVQFAIGVLIKNPESEEREKIFVPPNCRLIAGRDPANPIHTNDRQTSRHHCAFDADDQDVYIEELGSVNGAYVNGVFLKGKRRLEAGDTVQMGDTTFSYHKLFAH